MESITTATDQYGERIYYTNLDSWGKIEIDGEETLQRQDVNFTTLDSINNYTGHSYDYVLEQYYAKNRMYAPINKRFTTIDPIKDGENFYGYVQNNPINSIDPLGLYSTSQLRRLNSLVGSITSAKEKWMIAKKANNEATMAMEHTKANRAREEIKRILSNPSDSLLSNHDMSSLSHLLGRVISPNTNWSSYLRIIDSVEKTIAKLSDINDKGNSSNNSSNSSSSSNNTGGGSKNTNASSTGSTNSNNNNTSTGTGKAEDKIKSVSSIIKNLKLAKNNGVEFLTIAGLKNLTGMSVNENLSSNSGVVYESELEEGSFYFSTSGNVGRTVFSENRDFNHESNETINFSRGGDGFRTSELLSYFQSLKCMNSKSQNDKVILPFNYKVDHIPLDSVANPKDNYGNSIPRRSGKKLTSLDYITIHSTGNANSTAQNERDWLVNPGNHRTASFHIAVDENEAVEVLPLDEVALHASSVTGNNHSIGIEITHSGDRTKTLENAIILTAKLLQDNNLTTSDLRMHNDWNGKNCPSILIDPNYREQPHQTWDWFKKEIDKLL